MRRFIIISATLLMLSTLASYAGTRIITYGEWKIEIDTNNGNISALFSEDTVLNRSNAAWGADGMISRMASCTSYKVSVRDNKDAYGYGRTITLKAREGKKKVEQRIYLYEGRPYIHTEIQISASEGVELNYMAPICSEHSFRLFSSPGNHSLFVPFDNDTFIRYRNIAFGEAETESYGVTAFFNSGSRKGLVTGALEHTDWKSGIKAVTAAEGRIDSLAVYGGASSKWTRDLLPHGKLTGRSIKSPRMTIGIYDDWREGLESFGEQCATAAPKLPSLGGRPFGWNSWGALAEKITFEKAMEVSDFIYENIQQKGFQNEGSVYVDLDSFWDFGFKPHQHRIFTEHCRAKGQKPGIYWCPFTYWGRSHKDKVVEGMDYRWQDVYLRAKGRPIVFDGGIAIDPSHPAVKLRIERQMKEFIEWGYEYVKVDFMAHGSYQADSYYDPSITTGMQAYNHGMKFLTEQTEGKLWINLSIAPLFPGNYAHSRRISCDAWADINNTEYVLNSLTYGWWLDRIYHYNDADHIVFRNASEGENRARITSAAITGIYFLGDDMSMGGSDKVKDKVIRNSTNNDINEIARTCSSFRPVEAGTGDRSADMFYHVKGEIMYLAIFNFERHPVKKSLHMQRLGLSDSNLYKADELWSGESLMMGSDTEIEIPSKDVKVYRIWLSLP